MGYRRDDVIARYDTELDTAPIRYVRFGRNVFPINTSGGIEVEISQVFPAADRRIKSKDAGVAASTASGVR